MKIFLLISLLSLLGCSGQDVHTGSTILALNHSDNTITTSALSKDGQFNIVVDSKAVCVWKNSQIEAPLHCLQGSDAEFIELVEISENNQFYIISNQVSVRLYSLEKNQQIGEWQIADNIINDMDISANGSKVLLGFRTGRASVIDVNSNTITTFDKHHLDINSVSLSNDGTVAFTGSSDKKAMAWYTNTGVNIHEFSHGSRVNHVSISGDAKIGFTLDAIKDRIFWDLSTGSQLSKLDTHLRFFEFNDSLFSSNNSLLLTGSPKQVIKLWRVTDGALLAEWQSTQTLGRASVLSVAFVDQNKIATSNSDGLFEQWLLPSIQASY